MAMDRTMLSARVREALLRNWDPIGVRSFAEANDEYDSYVPDVCALLLRRASLEEIFAYLWWLETERMGLRGDSSKTKLFSEQIAQLADQLS